MSAIARILARLRVRSPASAASALARHGAAMRREALAAKRAQTTAELRAYIEARDRAEAA